MQAKQRQRESQWCTDNFLNYRALAQARDICHQLLTVFYTHAGGLRSGNQATTAATAAVETTGTSVSSSTSGSDEDKQHHAELLRKSFLAGFFAHTATRQADGSYLTGAERQVVHIHPASTLHRKQPEHVFYNELVMTSKQYMRDVSVYDPRWLPEVAPRLARPVVSVDALRPSGAASAAVVASHPRPALKPMGATASGSMPRGTHGAAAPRLGVVTTVDRTGARPLVPRQP